MSLKEFTLIGRTCVIKENKQLAVGAKRTHSEASDLVESKESPKRKRDIKAESNADFKSFLGI